MKSGRRASGVIVLAVFAAVELLSPLPGFHQHANELGVLLGASGSQISPSGAIEKSNPNCPACAIFGLSALTTFGPAAAGAAVPARAIPLFSVSFPIAIQHSIERGRAPPSS